MHFFTNLVICYYNYSVVVRYEIMRSCWKFEPIERPDFSELVKRIGNLKDTYTKR